MGHCCSHRDKPQSVGGITRCESQGPADPRRTTDINAMDARRETDRLRQSEAEQRLTKKMRKAVVLEMQAAIEARLEARLKEAEKADEEYAREAALLKAKAQEAAPLQEDEESDQVAATGAKAPAATQMERESEEEAAQPEDEAAQSEKEAAQSEEEAAQPKDEPC